MHFNAICLKAFCLEQKQKNQRETCQTSYLPSAAVLKKILLMMKLTAFLLVAAFLQVSAEGFTQSVTLSEKNVPLKKVFTKISKQTGFAFFCNESLLENTGMVSVKLKDATLQSALDNCLKEQNLTYTIIGNTVVIKAKEKIIPPVIVAEPETNLFVDIRGRVINEMGEPLAGASVKVKGTDIGTATDANGYFSVNTNLNNTLVISFVGYTPIEVVIRKQELGTFSLKLTENSVNEQVVVVGYGKVQRKNLTGSVASVKSTDVVKSPEVSLNSALQGRAAGVSVVSSSGDPGAPVNIIIRGGSSISASNDPLYVINGFPQLGGSNLNINVNDIESIDILKDGEAAAYGSRGANGVILITTKSGKSGKFSISYVANVTSQAIARKIKSMNTGQFAEFQHFLQRRSLFGDTSVFRNYQGFKDSATINWMDRISRTPIGQSHTLSMSGGTENLRYLVSMGYFNQPGILLGSKYDRYTSNINLSSKLNKIVSNETVIYLSKGIKTGADVTGLSGAVYSAVRGAPYLGTGYNTLTDFILNHLGGIYGSFGSDPLAETRDPKLKESSFELNFNTAFTFRITDHLNFKVSGGVSNSDSKYKFFYPTTTSSGSLPNGRGGVSTGEYLSWLNENTLNYTNLFKGIHNVDATLGFSMQKTTNEFYRMEARNFNIQSLGYDALDIGTLAVNPGSGKSQSQLASLFGIVRYTLKDRYLFTAQMRADGSSKFPKNRWGYFPYVGVGWKIHEEPFFAGVKNISTLKLSINYAHTGNEGIPSYSSLSRYSRIPSNRDAEQGLTTALVPMNYGVGDLRWETNIQSNLQLNLGLFNDRILLTADAYHKKSKDLLLADEISVVSGYSAVYRNVGDVEVKGLEFNLNTQNIKGKKFSWYTNFNIAFTKGKVLKLNGKIDEFISSGGRNANFLVKVGERLGNMYGYVVDGIYNTTEEFYNSPENQVLSANVGFRKFKDISGEDGKPDGVVDDFDRTILGNGNPKFFGGFNNEFRFSNIDFSFLFTYSYGNDVINMNKSLYTLAGLWQSGLEEYYLHHFTNQNPQVNANAWSGAYDNEWDQTTSYLVEDGSYLRLKNIMLGYTLPVQKFNNSFVKSLRLYLSAQNLLTFTKYTGFDPEVNLNNSILVPGVDYGSYPRSRFYSLGINANF